MVDLAIIAAGDGIRLKSEGVKVSKPMVEINGIPLIKRIIDIAVKNGTNSVSSIINESSNDLKNYLTSGELSVPINIIVKSTESSLHSLYELSKTATTPFLLTTSDSVFLEKEFTSFINFALNKSNADAVFAVTDFIDDEKPLYVSINDESEIENFYDVNNEFEFVTGGLYLFKKSIKDEVEEAVKSGIVRLRNFQRFLIKKGYKIDAYPFSKIIDVDHVTDIEKAKIFLNNNMETV
jgi:NDP-sugar pyrophosphorylase family protein